MKKSRAVVTLILTVLAICALGWIAVNGIGEDRKGCAANIKQGLDLAGGVSITYQVVGEEAPSSEDMADTIYKLQQRVQGYSTEAVVYQEGGDRINIEIPGVSDANAILEELGRPGSLIFMDMEGNTVITGTQVANAQARSTKNDMGNAQVVVELSLTEDGKEAFAEATTKAAVNHDIIYIVYDNEIISYPSVNEPILDGTAIITGMGSYEEAQILASTIRIGGLKLELEELRSNVVGAQLGEEAIESSLKAGVIGFALVAVFMIAVYFLQGFAAVLALTIYVAMTIVTLNAFDVTLTLPGIAGIILSIGMAVDANVVIFARIREELATGKTVKSAIKIGYQKALSAVVDGNLTTLIAAFVLWLRGSGSVKGFATTLAIGIVLSMFTALVVTRYIVQALFAMGLKSEKFYGVGKAKKTIPFLSKKGIFFGVSVVCILAGFVCMGLNKANPDMGQILNYSMEFRGGTATTVTFNEDMSIADIDSQVVPVVEDAIGEGAVQTQKVAGTNEVVIKTRTLTVEEREALNTMLADNFEVDTEKIIAETISSTISAEMKQDAIIAVAIATLLMLVYIWFRFKDIRFGASAIIALVHDVLVVLAFYAAAKISVGSTFIACMLTIVGYSINATIVIFDRIRENLAEMRNTDLKDIVNISISQTLSRSIFTSLTTFFMVAALYAFGVTSIREFALPLMAGIVCGTYSSVCITGALWYVLKTKIKKLTN